MINIFLLSTPTNTFSFTESLISALIGAFIVQVLSWIINWHKIHVDLKRKKNMILQDLANKTTALDKAQTCYFDARDFVKKGGPHFAGYCPSDLNLEIYNSVPKDKLYSIFGEKVNKLVNTYRLIESIDQESCVDYVKEYLKHEDLILRNQSRHRTIAKLADYLIVNIEGKIELIEHIKSNIKELSKVGTTNQSFPDKPTN